MSEQNPQDKSEDSSPSSAEINERSPTIRRRAEVDDALTSSSSDSNKSEVDTDVTKVKTANSQEEDEEDRTNSDEDSDIDPDYDHTSSAVPPRNSTSAGNTPLEVYTDEPQAFSSPPVLGRISRISANFKSKATGEPPYDNWDADPAKPRRGILWGTLFFMFATIQSLGIVYGDIGTSPLYVYQTIFSTLNPYSEDDLLGAQSLIIYSLIFVVGFKYAGFILIADQKGEGGILSLLSLVPPDINKGNVRKVNKDGTIVPWPRWVLWWKKFAIIIGILGAAFLLGDGGITPAISVLSALEGLSVKWTGFSQYEIPFGIAVIIAIFLSQRLGTSKIGWTYGPIIGLWFFALGGIGIWNIIGNPRCLKSFDPRYMIIWFINNGSNGYWLLGSVVLSFTGVEAFYADIGHIGKWPMRVSWTFMAFPALTLSYLGHCAALMDHPEYLDTSIFFEAIPSKLYWPMLLLATAAAVIASQAIISASYSLIDAGIQQELFPAVTIYHTSKREKGQIYIPMVNWCLMAFTIFLIVYFQNSTNMGNAYAIAVTGTISITTILYLSWVVLNRPWLTILAIPIGGFFLGIDLIFFTSTWKKIPDGGWVPLVAAFLLYILMFCWWRGRLDLNRANSRIYRGMNRMNSTNIASMFSKEGNSVNNTPTEGLTTEKLVSWLQRGKKNGHPRKRIAGTGVFVEQSACPKTVAVFQRNIGALPKTIIILHVRKSTEVAKIDEGKTVRVKKLGKGLWEINVRMGYLSRPMDVRDIIRRANEWGGLKLAPNGKQLSYYFLNETLENRLHRRFWVSWRIGVYNWMNRALTETVEMSKVKVPWEKVVVMGSVLPVNAPSPSPRFGIVGRFFNK